MLTLNGKQCANTYKIADYDPQLPSVPHAHQRSLAPARTVTFQDLSTPADRAPSGSQAQHAVSLPNPELLTMHAALASVLYATGLASVFERIEDTLDRERPGVQDLPVPDPDGVSFWRDVVAGDAGHGEDPARDLEDFARVLGVPARA